MRIACPECPFAVTVSEADPDASLAELYDHLHVHTWDPGEHTRLFTAAQEAAR